MSTLPVSHDQITEHAQYNGESCEIINYSHDSRVAVVRRIDGSVINVPAHDLQNNHQKISQKFYSAGKFGAL